MLISGEELFLVSYESDVNLTILYAPLRSLIMLVSKKNAGLILKQGNNDVKQRVLDYIKKKKLIDIKRGYSEISLSEPSLSISLTNDCNSVAIPNINVAPDGKIWACARESNPEIFNYGYFDFLNKKVILYEKKLEVLRKLNIFNIPECANCFCKYHCSGDCSDNRFSGYLTKCVSIQDSFVGILNQYYNSTQGG